MADIILLSPSDGDMFEIGDSIDFEAIVYLSDSEEEKDWEVAFKVEENEVDMDSPSSDGERVSGYWDSDNLRAGGLSLRADLYKLNDEGERPSRATAKSDEVRIILTPPYPEEFSGWAIDVVAGEPFWDQYKDKEGNITCYPLPAWNWNEYVDAINNLYLYSRYQAITDPDKATVTGLGKIGDYKAEEEDLMERSLVNKMIDLLADDWKNFIDDMFGGGEDIRLFRISTREKISAETFIRLERFVNFIIEHGYTDQMKPAD